MIFFSPLPFLKSAVELFFVASIAALLGFSLFCICFILLIRFKSRSSRHLQNFNSLWTVRFLFVVFIACWALTEVIRLPLFPHIYLRPLFPQLTPPQQASFCKLHLVLSLGFFEPGFLVILLFLLDVSVKQTTPKSFLSVFYVFASCVPLFLLQVYFVFLDGSDVCLPETLNRIWFRFSIDQDHDDATIMCAYPFVSTVLFGIFGVIFILSFMLSFWKVVSHVINKALKVRIFALAFTILIFLPLQILLMGLSAFWTPNKTTHDGFAIAVFLTTFACAVVGEGILVIKPIADSLNAICGRAEQPLPENCHGESSSAPPPAEDGVGAVTV
ncbi:candidate G-protein Coupled Receptor 1 [Hibiscus trionum]|uniref:Candidate G-protein Coupled Receptor 1 n=1 Tax=Hibiscus trionum TaxID=183268 RepID=A0A9W7HFS0_HIBTR|nr:candidate G-protein Coupled Receptor 1 [Hibiscus trionum]